MGNKICWAPGGTVNPVVGCWGPGGTEAKPHRCPWCYAKCDLLRAMDWARDNGTPLWLKDGCYDLWPDLPRRQELPEGMVG